jgi:predicted HTH domain antitoxin
MEMTMIEINVPKDIIPYVLTKDEDVLLKRNALLLYPYIENSAISHGKAAELLGMHKLDLINLYGKMGLAYFNLKIDEVEEDVETIRRLRSKHE